MPPKVLKTLDGKQPAKGKRPTKGSREANLGERPKQLVVDEKDTLLPRNDFRNGNRMNGLGSIVPSTSTDAAGTAFPESELSLEERAKKFAEILQPFSDVQMECLETTIPFNVAAEFQKLFGSDKFAARLEAVDYILSCGSKYYVCATDMRLVMRWVLDARKKDEAERQKQVYLRRKDTSRRQVFHDVKKLIIEQKS